MQVQIEYVFPSEPVAYRFLNTVKYFEAEDIRVKRGRSASHVIIRYRYADSGFDDTAARLDDLAREMSGEECR